MALFADDWPLNSGESPEIDWFWEQAAARVEWRWPLIGSIFHSDKRAASSNFLSYRNSFGAAGFILAYRCQLQRAPTHRATDCERGSAQFPSDKTLSRARPPDRRSFIRPPPKGAHEMKSNGGKKNWPPEEASECELRAASFHFRLLLLLLFRFRSRAAPLTSKTLIEDDWPR